eukprot:10298656-Alexandrium_andersonii.AAC.1
MSASLVGSEMCIRDSYPPCPRPGSTPAVELRGSSSREMRGASPGAAPVSYTHLTLPTICSV